MTKVAKAVASRARRKKVLVAAKGARGRASKNYKVARQRVDKSRQYAYRDRRVKKRTFRSLWIQRINAAARLHGLTYGAFIHLFKKAGLTLNRKMLAEAAVGEPATFRSIVDKLKKATDKARQ